MGEDGTRVIGCTVVFVVTDLQASVDYYRDGLGFMLDFKYGAPPIFAGVYRDEVMIYLQHESETQRAPGASSLCIAVEDVDAMYRELCRREARILKQPASYAYGLREFNVEDPDGNAIVFGSPDDSHE